MKQTAVEWFNQQLVDRQNGNGDSRSRDEILDQAKVMFEEQMFEFWQGGINCTEEDGKSFDQYYNQTY